MTDVANLVVRVNSDSSGLVAGLNGAKGALGSFGVAALAVGAVSVKMAADFEDSMQKIVGLVGVSQKQVDAWQQDILELSGATAQAPKDLADAMFFVTSAGLRGQKALSALTVSAKASAAGLGDTMTIADAVTSAMNSYAQSGLTAAEATDVMVAAVREGKLPAADLAGVLGNVLPIASQVGVSFDQVAAAIASATRQGLQASRAATGIRFLLTAFIKPSQQAEEALNHVGISLGELQASLAQRGLLATLQMLSQRFDLSSAAGRKMFATVVGGARGLSVASILVGQNLEDVRGVFDATANAAGSLDRAFKVASQTAGFQFRQALNDLRIVLIEFGAKALPVAVDLIDALHGALRLLGPVLKIVGANAGILLTAWLGYRALLFLPGLLHGIATAFAEIGAVGIAGWATKAAGAIGALASSIVSLPGAFALAVAAVTKWGLSQDAADAATRQHMIDMGLFTTQATGVGTAMVQAADGATVLRGTWEEATKRANDLNGKLIEQRGRMAAGAAEAERMAEAQQLAAESTYRLRNRTVQLTEEQIKAAKEARTKWIEEQTASFDALSMGLIENRHQWSLTAAAAVRGANRMAEVQRTIARDLRDLNQMKIGDNLKRQIAQLGPDMVHAFVNGTRNQRRQIANALKGYDEAYNDTKNRIAKIAPQIPKQATDASMGPAKSGSNSVGLAWGQGFANGINSSIPSIRSAAIRAANAAYAAAQDALQSHSPSRRTRQLGIDFMTGFARGITDGAQKVIDAVRTEMQRAIDEAKNAKGAEAAQWTAYANALKATIPQAKALGAAADDLADRIEKLHNRVNEFRDAIRSSFDVDLVGGLADVLRQQQEAAQALADARAQGQEVTAEMLSAAAPVDLTAYLRQQVAQMQAWGKALVSLREAGLNQQSLMEFAGQGPEALPLAQTLLASPELIGQLNAAQRDITKAMGQTMDTLVDQVFGEQIRRAADQLDRLRGRLHDFVQNVADATVQVGQMSRALEHALDRLSGRLNQLERGGTTGGLDRVAKDTTEPVVVNVYGDVVSEGDLVDKIHLGLLRKQKRTPLGLIP